MACSRVALVRARPVGDKVSKMIFTLQVGRPGSLTARGRNAFVKDCSHGLKSRRCWLCLGLIDWSVSADRLA